MTSVPAWIRSQRIARYLCVVCGDPAITEWAGGSGDTLCQRHLTERQDRSNKP